MKIITWNCNGAFRKKLEALAEYQTDIMVIQECEDPGRSKDAGYKSWATNYIWKGDNQYKGLGVFAGKNIQLQELDWDSSGLEYFISCRINGDFNLIATWCHGANKSKYKYIGQMWQYVQRHKSKFQTAVILGDFNSNAFWDKAGRNWNHSDVVQELKEVGIHSVYHNYFDEEQGKENKPTFYLVKNLNKPYHLDYIFASRELTDNYVNLSVGNPDQWLSLSDHMPIFCELRWE